MGIFLGLIAILAMIGFLAYGLGHLIGLMLAAAQRQFIFARRIERMKAARRSGQGY